MRDDSLHEKNEKQAAIERENEEARLHAAEEKQRKAEEALKPKEEARRLRAEAKQYRMEQTLAQQEELRRIQAEEKRKQFELAKQQEERLAEEEKARRERQHAEALANTTILYPPGEEPEKLRNHLDTLFEKLDGAYPDKKISRLNQDHRKWGETVTEFYRLFGYPD